MGGTSVPNGFHIDLMRVRQAAADYVVNALGTRLTDLEVVKLIQRPFSDVTILKVITDESQFRIVLKTTKHHSVNKYLTERDNQALVEYNILSQLYPRFKNIQMCSVPQPLFVIPEIETYAMEFVDGELLADKHRFTRYFSSSNGFTSLRQDYLHIGRWLKYFHDFTGMRPAGNESFQEVAQRCEYRLGLIRDLKDHRCPANFIRDISAYIETLLRKLNGKTCICAGRHGDFGSWNIITGQKGVIVIDFLGYDVDLISIDILKILMDFENEKKSFSCDPSRMELLKTSFLEGYGPLPEVDEHAYLLCETFHRICSVFGSLSGHPSRLHHKIEADRCLKANLKWLLDEKARKPLWPFKMN